MTSVSTGYAASLASVKQLDTSKLTMKQLTSEELQSHFARMEKFLEARHRQFPDLSSHPAYQDYATVEVNGKVVATIDNHGFATTSNSVGAKLAGQLPGSVNGKTGPVLAQVRAELIAGMLGGTVVKSASAITQAAFDRLPQPSVTVDQAALQADPLYASLQKARQAASTFAAQQIAQETDEAEAAGGNGSPAADAFLDYMAKTPEERYFEAFLKAKGMTKEKFEALPAEEQQALLQEFEEAVKQSVEAASIDEAARAEASGLL